MLAAAATQGLASLALLLGLGALVHWLAWRLRLPAILLLLLAGFVVGPGLGWLDPDAVFGAAFQPLVSIAVALILFEGGLSLRFDELRGASRVVTSLVSVGALVTWALSTAAGVLIGVPFDLALLVGAILVLTGPTVVIPLVRHVRPRAPLGPILRWEGILIDPIGALLALLVLEAITAGSGFVGIAGGIGRTLLCGGGLGLLAAAGLGRAFARYVVPDMLQVPVVVGVVAAAFVGANWLQPEAGLLAVTVLGIRLANRRGLDTAHIGEWLEQLATILLAVLFLCIAARLPLEQLTGLGWWAVLYTAALVVVVRPVAVWVATLRSGLAWRERAFLMAIAPRGIVVAAVSSEFSLYLERAGHPESGTIVALVFPVIVLSVLVYGLLAAPVARRLGVAAPDPQGVLIVGGDRVGREIAVALRDAGVDVLLVDTNAGNAALARTAGVRTWHGSVLSSRFADEAELSGIGALLALTPSPEVNRLALRQFQATFGRARSYQVAPPATARLGREGAAGRVLFHGEATLDRLRERLQRGDRIRATRLTEQFGPAQYDAMHAPPALPLFVLGPGPGPSVAVVAVDQSAVLRPGCTVLTLVPTSPSAADASIATQRAGP